MEQLTTTNILSLFETTKEQRTTFVQDTIARLRDGETDPLKVHLQLKAMEEIINALTNTTEKTNKLFTVAIDYKTILLTAAEKHGKKFQLHNAEFSIKEVGTKYDFSKCNHSELIDLIDDYVEIGEKIKNIQDLLKTVPIAGLDIRIGDELATIYPPSKTSTTAVAVSLK